MPGNVITWKSALQLGWKPTHYPYTADQVPIGTYEVILDFKCWAKKVMAINCYFTVKDTGKKIQLTVYCREPGIYKLPNNELDFTNCRTQTVYLIEVIADQKKKVKFSNAQVV